MSGVDTHRVRFPRPPRAFVLAALLVVAGGGVATGAKLITGADVKDASLTGRDIRDGSIGARDLAPKLRTALTRAGQTGPRGEAGPQGAAGPQGPAGAAATGGVPVRDGNGVHLGGVVNVSLNYFTVVTSTGHVISLMPNGHSYDQPIYWTGASCTGTPYLRSFSSTANPLVGGYVVYSPTAGGLLAPADIDANGQAPNAAFTFASTSTDTCSASVASDHGYRMQAVTPASVGLPAYPVAAPLTLR